MRDGRMPLQLPNGDIYLGPDPDGRPDNISAMPPDVAKNVGEVALEKAVKDATHQPQQARVECPWCGQISEGTENFKLHLTKQHAKDMARSAQEVRATDQEAEEYAAERRAERAAEEAKV